MRYPVVPWCRCATSLAVILATWFAAAPAADENPHLAERLKAVEALLKKRFPADQPGAVVVLIADGKVALEKGYGLADLDTKRPITPQSAFDDYSSQRQKKVNRRLAARRHRRWGRRGRVVSKRVRKLSI